MKIHAANGCFQSISIDIDFLYFVGDGFIKSAQRVFFGGCASLKHRIRPFLMQSKSTSTSLTQPRATAQQPQRISKWI